MILAGITPDQGAFLMKAAWFAVEIISASVALWIYSHRYTIKGFIKRMRCHL